jgi:hypothetical protein
LPKPWRMQGSTAYTSLSHTNHNQSKKAHRNGIKRPQSHRSPSMKGVRGLLSFYVEITILTVRFAFRLTPKSVTSKPYIPVLFLMLTDISNLVPSQRPIRSCWLCASSAFRSLTYR